MPLSVTHVAADFLNLAQTGHQPRLDRGGTRRVGALVFGAKMTSDRLT